MRLLRMQEHNTCSDHSARLINPKIFAFFLAAAKIANIYLKQLMKQI